jgi:dihydrofolate reductase
MFPDTRWTAKVTPASAQHLRNGIARVGALVCGRRLFDLTKGWGGRHTIDVPVFVVTHRGPDDWPHPEAPFTFVTDGVESAIAQAKATAGDKNVAIASANIAQQCLNAGLLDEICVDLAPVLLGKGIPFFTKLAGAPVLLDNPEVVQGDRVTHLTYRVQR